jgi:hypothetical protein
MIRTLEVLSTGISIEKEKVHVDPTLLFSRLLVILEREDSVKKYFSYELTPVPTSLFQDGMMRKATKSMLAKALTKDITTVPSYECPVFVVDGGALLHKVKWFPNVNFQKVLADQYSKYLFEKYGLCCIVFDGYDNGPCIRDHEHKRRSGKRSANVTVTTNSKVSVSLELFLKNGRNKSQLIELLSSQLAREGHDIRNSSGDADTLIVSTAIEYASKNKEVVVVASDTDILVLLMFHWTVNMKITLYSEKKQWKIEDVVKQAGEMIAQHILFIHAWAGCDTTSAIYGKGNI